MPDPDLVRPLASIRNTMRAVLVVLLLLLAVETVPLIVAALVGRKVVQAVQPGAASPEPAGTPFPGIVVTKGASQPVKLGLGYGIFLNKDSSLVREWLAVNSNQVPVEISGPAEVVIAFKTTEYRSEYSYKANVDVTVKQPLSALEIKFLTFDAWGEHVRTLSYTTLEDLVPGKKTFGGAWSLHSENEAEEYYASIAYIARVRTTDGKVITADTAPIVHEAKKFSAKFTADDLEQGKPAPAPSSPAK